MQSFDVTVPRFVLECFVILSMQEMTDEERVKMTDLKKCNFSEMSEYFKAQSEARKAMSKEEKQVSFYYTISELHLINLLNQN